MLEPRLARHPLGDNYFEVSTTLTVGTDADGVPNERLPAPTGSPTVVVTEGQVEIRSIFMEFSGDLYRDEPDGTREMEEYHIWPVLCTVRVIPAK